MNYEEGIVHMIRLKNALTKDTPRGTFTDGELTIDYPGYKEPGDYRLSVNGKAPRHADIINIIFNLVTRENFTAFSDALDDIYQYGLYSTQAFFPENDKKLIYWITLQEEINYPQSQHFSGRKLPYQRFYEAGLAKLGFVKLTEVHRRATNIGQERPALYENLNIGNIPSFYR